MTLPPARDEDIADICAKLQALGPFPDRIARGLAARDPDAMRNAVIQLITAKRTRGLREIVDRFRATSELGVFARVQGSRLHRLEGDNLAALFDIEEAIAVFPERAAPFLWFLKVEYLEALNRTQESEAAAREVALRFPDDPAAVTSVARLLGQRARWPEALAAWEEGFARFGDKSDGEMFVGGAQALLHLGRVEEALASLEARVAQAPDDFGALRELAAIAAQTGDNERRLSSLAVLTGRFATQSRPDWWADLARARHEARDYEDGAAALAELERRFPTSPLAERERLRLDWRLERGQDELAARAERAVARFPEDDVLRGQWVLMLLAKGRLEEAERFVEDMEADDAQGALVARLRLEADRGGDAHLRAFVEKLPLDQKGRYAETMGLAEFLFQYRAPWALAFADALLTASGAEAAGRIEASVLGAKLKIGLREDAAALAIIDAIPAAFRRPEVNELRAWAAYRRGRLDEAQAIWRRNVRDVYFGAIDCPIDTLDLLSPNLPPPDQGVTAYVVYRNEAAQLPAFLAHHRKIGVRRFVFFDHMSSDESCALLLNQPDVVLYQSRDSYQFSSSGRRWVAEIVAREGAKGWGLHVDPDEYFIYPGWETAPLDRLVAYLEARGFAGVRAYMLDMFARTLIGEDGEPAPLSAHRYYDDDHVWMGHFRSPYLSPVGGVRQRLFGATEFLHKTPLWRLDAAQMLNSHETTPLALADVSGALLHYKLFNMTLRGQRATPKEGGLPYLEPDTNLEVLRRHSRYAARLDKLWRADLFDPRVSREIGDSLEMTARGLMTASTEYLEGLRA